MGDVYAPIFDHHAGSTDITKVANWYDQTTKSNATHLPGVDDTVNFAPMGVAVVGGMNVGTIHVMPNAEAILGGPGTYTAQTVIVDGYLALASNITAGKIVVESGGSLEMSQSVDLPLFEGVAVSVLTGDLVLAAGGHINLGAHNLNTDTLENANESAGNSYNPAANIAGSGALLQYPGSAPLSEISTEKMDFGTVHVGDVLAQSITIIDGTGDFGGVLMNGWFQSSGLTDNRLSAVATPNNGGDGNPPLPAVPVPAPFSFGGRGGRAIETITLNASSAGSLDGQSAQIRSQFGGFSTTGSSGWNQSASIPITGTVNNYAQPSFVLISAPAGSSSWQTADGTTVTYLGWAPQGGLLGSVTLGLANAATGPADLMAGLTADYQDGGFAVNSNAAAFNLGAGQQQATESLTMNTSAPGWHWDAVAQQSVGYNASGYAGMLPTSSDILIFYVQPHA